MHPQQDPPPRSNPAAIRGCVLGVALLGAALAACGAEPRPTDTGVSVTDPTGRTTTLEAPARRVVSLIPSVTEWIIAIGAVDRLVARTDFDRQPALDTLPSVGAGLTPSVEWLTARGPDLVIAWPDAPSRSLVSRLEQVGIPVFTAPAESVDDALTVARGLGVLLGRPDAADSVIAAVRTGLDSLRAARTGRAPPSVLYLVGLDPLMAAGPGTFIDELLTVAGGRNALADMDIHWPHVSLEVVVQRAPDVVIVASTGMGQALDRLDQRPGWRDVPAVRQGRVFAVDPDLNRPGPEIHTAAGHLADLIHSRRGRNPADPGSGP